MQSVKISYTVGLDELPSEVSRLLADVRNKLESLSKVVDEVRKENLQGIDIRTLDPLQNLHQEFFKLDQQVSDVQGIIRGYCDYKLQEGEDELLEDEEEYSN